MDAGTKSSLIGNPEYTLIQNVFLSLKNPHTYNFGQTITKRETPTDNVRTQAVKIEKICATHLQSLYMCYMYICV